MRAPLCQVLSVVLGTLPVSGLLGSGPIRYRPLSWPSVAALLPVLLMIAMPVVSVYVIMTEGVGELKGIDSPFSVVFNLSAVVVPLLLLFVAQRMKAGAIAELLRACADLRRGSSGVTERRWLVVVMAGVVVLDAGVLLWCVPRMEAWRLGALISAGIYGQLLRVLVLWQMLSALLEIGDRFQEVSRLLEEPAETDAQLWPTSRQQVLHGGTQTAQSRRGSVYTEYSHCLTPDVALFLDGDGLTVTRPVSPDPREQLSPETPFEDSTNCLRCCRKRPANPRNASSPPPHQTVKAADSTALARIQLLRHRHAATARLLSLFNEAFGTQLLMLTLFSFGLAVGVVLPEYSYLPVERRVPVTISQLAIGLLNVSSLCLAGQRVTTAARRPLTLLGLPLAIGGSPSTLQQKPRSEADRETRLETQLETVQATLQVQTAEADVSAAGLFYVNCGTLLSLVAALVTYGVILQQMAEAEAAQGTAATVLPPRMAGGPHGLGDPDDRSLRRVEVEVLIPKIMRDLARSSKCVEEADTFSRCCNENGLTMVYKCRKENEALRSCLTRWYEDPAFRQECTDIYLDERSAYRATGLKAKLRRKGSDMF
ncbi:COX assembly mitochondrial [Amphibalanus amphitrite]|uniref:COX assembly mitochondrial n=1 Tax=Amphibalanus amphitrite TaxID=1232801 RepID=A0A6A4WBI0_AMPAM|nr:COX assembly mitochondrial [Amphibalanus amphitrite]